MHADILIGHGHHQMEIETLSYAQSLRVIGQQLDGLGVDSFKLDKRGDEYIVQTDDSESTETYHARKHFLGVPTKRSGDRAASLERFQGLYTFPRQIFFGQTMPGA